MGGGGGSSSKYVKEQYEYDLKKWDFDIQQMRDRESYTKKAHDIKVWNQQQKIDYKNAMQVQQWQDKEKMRIFDYNNQIKAYNASVEAFETQLDYNNLAAEIASSDNTRQYNERLVAIGFQNEELMQKHGFSTRTATQEIQGKQAEQAFKGEDLKLKSMAATGKIQNLGQSGRTARKNMHASIAAYGQQQAALVDSITRSDSAYGFQMEQYNKGTALNQRQLRESMKSAGSQYEADATKIALDKYSADLQAEANIAPEPVEQPQMSKPLDLPVPRNLEPMEGPTDAQLKATKPIKGAIGKPSVLQQMAGVVGTVASVASMFGISDDRLKYDITRVGTSKSGIPKYTFRYRFEGKHGPKYMGTSAQDLIAMGRKDAVGQTEKDGFYYVDYGKLDVTMEVVTT